ncbi:hypothetical protein WJX84_009514 [Apatococcus fuscideae]|uniref:Uncharacterized protein n=1 Tax=Apatococcus fuscideae TaxID=2026836 RepID=A0AAW1TGI9_9CHLO
MPAEMAKRTNLTVLQQTMSSLWRWQKWHSSREQEEAEHLYAALTKDQLAEPVRSSTLLHSLARVPVSGVLQYDPEVTYPFELGLVGVADPPLVKLAQQKRFFRRCPLSAVDNEPDVKDGDEKKNYV